MTLLAMTPLAGVASIEGTPGMVGE